MTFLFLLFLGWRQLRKHLLPPPPAKLPPSGAPPWSRERPIPPWGQANNFQGAAPGVTGANEYGQMNPAIMPTMPTPQGFSAPQPGIPYQGYRGPQLSSGIDAPRAYSETSSTVDLAPSTGSFLPLTDQSVSPVTGEFASLSPATGPQKAVLLKRSTRLIPMGDHHTNAALPIAPSIPDEQWAGSVENPIPDLNDPHLQEMIRHYSEKGRAIKRQTGQPDL